MLFGASILLVATRTRGSQWLAMVLGIGAVALALFRMPGEGRWFAAGCGLVLASLSPLPRWVSEFALRVIGLCSVPLRDPRHQERRPRPPRLRVRRDLARPDDARAGAGLGSAADRRRRGRRDRRGQARRDGRQAEIGWGYNPAPADRTRTATSTTDGASEILCDGNTVLVQADDVTVGRTGACTVRVVHPLVSREHCRLEIRADGLFVVDLGSVNGTWLNGTRVDGRLRGPPRATGSASVATARC